MSSVLVTGLIKLITNVTTAVFIIVSFSVPSAWLCLVDYSEHNHVSLKKTTMLFLEGTHDPFTMVLHGSYD